MIKRLLKQDWDAIAGILAAITALILHLLHFTDIDTLLAIAIVLMAILLLRDFKRENQADKLQSSTERMALALEEMKRAIRAPDVTLIGPTELRTASLQFAQKGQGEVVFFNVCLRMYKAQQPFNVMLKPFIDNPEVTSARFVLDNGEKERWRSDVLPKISACTGCKKVEEPYWCDLKDNISFVIVETGAEGQSEALVSFWGEPFMAIGTDKNVPRYVLHVASSSELVARLKEKERICRSQ
jgi:hypothetical protein